MNLLCTSYVSDEEEEGSLSGTPESHHVLSVSQSGSGSSSGAAGPTNINLSQPTHQPRDSQPHVESRVTSQPVIGYTARRKRKGYESQETSSSAQSASSVNLLSPYLTHDPLRSTRKQVKHTTSIPRHTKCILTEHSKPVLSLEWHPCDPRLLLSASLDGGVRLWDLESRGSVCVATYNLHSGAVRDVEWVTSETAITAGYDSTAVYVDVGYSKEIARLKHSAFVSVATAHPSDSNLVLSGDFDGRLQLWDLRSGNIIKHYKGACGKILDATFLPRGDTFVASTDIVRKNAFSQAMNIWDVDSGVTLTHQLYFEPFSCPCLRVNRNREEFLAQSNGNYVVVFSAKKPYKLNKRRRFQGHYVSGFDVGFDMNPDGTVLCSASSEGKVHFYDYFSTKVIRTLTLTNSACLAIAWNRLCPSQVVVSDWTGNIYVLQ